MGRGLSPRQRLAAELVAGGMAEDEVVRKLRLRADQVATALAYARGVLAPRPLGELEAARLRWAILRLD